MKEEHLHSRAEARLDLSGRMLGALDLLAVSGALILLALSVGGMLDDKAARAAELDAQLALGLQARDAALNTRHFDGQAHFERGDAARAALMASHAPELRAASPLILRAFPATWLDAARSGGNVAVIASPSDLVAESGIGAVKLRWAPGSGGNVTVGSWVLLRATPGGAYAVVTELPVTTLEFADATPAGVEYQWRVAAKPLDPSLAQSVGSSEPSSPARGSALARLRWSILEVKESRVRFRIESWTGAAFEAREVELGAGDVVEIPGAGPSWSGGCKFETLRVEEASRQQEVLRVAFDREGRVILEGGLPLREPVIREVRSRRFEISIRTAAGTVEKVWFP